MSNQHVLTIMEVSINEMEQRDAVIGGIETIASLLYRYTYFEKLYLHTEPFLAGEIRDQVEKILKDLYTMVLVFLFKARNYFDHGIFGASSLLSVPMRPGLFTYLVSRPYCKRNLSSWRVRTTPGSDTRQRFGTSEARVYDLDG